MSDTGFMNNHAPGPWYSIDGRIYKDFGDTRYKIAEVDPYVWDDVEANAHLIAAAPELLQALELAERKLLRLHISLSLNEKAGRRSADKDPALQEIRAAINKAKGGQQ